MVDQGRARSIWVQQDTARYSAGKTYRVLYFRHPNFNALISLQTNGRNQSFHHDDDDDIIAMFVLNQVCLQ